MSISKEIVVSSGNYLVAAFGLVAALSWNEAVKKLIDTHIERGESIPAYFLYATGMTILAIGAGIAVKKVSEEVKA
jgi:hypothetical protein